MSECQQGRHDDDADTVYDHSGERSRGFAVQHLPRSFSSKLVTLRLIHITQDGREHDGHYTLKSTDVTPAMTP